MLRYLTVLLWIPISTQANVHQFINQETRLELSEILSRMDSTESILIFYHGKAESISDNTSDFSTYDPKVLKANIDLLHTEYQNFAANPYVHEVSKVQPLLAALYDQLLKPFEAKLTSRIRIFTDSTLAAIPWNILINCEGKYLIENHEIVVDRLSAHELRRSALVHKEVKLFLLAPMFLGESSIENEKEEAELKVRFSVNTADFTEADLIHISSHGLKEGIYVNASQEIFGKCDLESSRVLAKLAFLNTCYSHEMALCFIQAGAESAIGTHWKIDDRMAVDVAKYFYDHLSKGERPSTSLRSALLEYVQESEISSDAHPFHWGGYQVYGTDNIIIDYQEFDIRKFISLLLSICTTFSVFTYYFGRKVKGKLVEYNLI